jgi:hypothetical protein
MDHAVHRRASHALQICRSLLLTMTTPTTTSPTSFCPPSPSCLTVCSGCSRCCCQTPCSPSQQLSTAGRDTSSHMMTGHTHRCASGLADCADARTHATLQTGYPPVAPTPHPPSRMPYLSNSKLTVAWCFVARIVGHVDINSH